MDSNELDIRQQTSLDDAFEQADSILSKKYIGDLSKYNIMPVSNELKTVRTSQFTRLFKVDRIVYDKKENNQDKLLNIYNALYSCNGSVVLIVESRENKVDFYIGTKTTAGTVVPCQAVLSKALKGNYPGTKISSLRNSEVEAMMDGLFKSDFESKLKSVSAVTGISSLREDKGGPNMEFVQGIEKVIDAMRGENFALIIIADPVSPTQIDNVKSGYEALYSQLAPFASTDLNFSQNESDAVAESLTEGLSSSFSENLSKTQSYSYGGSKTNSTTKQKGSNRGISMLVVNSSKSSSKSVTKGGGTNWTNTDSETRTSGKTETRTNQTGTTNTATEGNARSLQIKMENKSVTALLHKIDAQLARLDECNNLGMWNCSAYIIADDAQTSQVLASAYQALTRGEKSGVESSAVTTWVDRDQLLLVSDYLKKLHHPMIMLGNSRPPVTPGSLISGDELTVAAGMPQRSVPGLAVYEFAPFGREVVRHNGEKGETVTLGKVYHMGVKDDFDMEIDCESLASHTFITGSTGSGKSNTIYMMLDNLRAKGINFLVIEPAKGEYKDIFGNYSDVSVYGTNPYKAPLLRINPFKFPEDIHVLEHIDRLIEIFNVCWPMYAAMPAVLKDAVLQAYEVCGWDLVSSVNSIDANLFPTFQDLLVELVHVIENSAYDREVKSNYKGSLETRVKSLANGLNGQIFSTDEIDNEGLFDSNVIVDLSRVGSFETKALIMGILVMRLNEYRMTHSQGMNVPLRHVTVLEEAHNILKKTSTQQDPESSNMAGKSVEMLSNAIAEMRTYGEGFIIADQSPSAVDVSAIRNTNTKIIMRLPDESDRRMAGKSAALKDEQLDEITKLPRGVAVVYQNDWLEPVLCNISKFAESHKPYIYTKEVSPITSSHDAWFKPELLRLLLKGRIDEHIDIDIDKMKEEMPFVSLSTKNKIGIYNLLSEFEKFGRLSIWEDKNFDVLSSLVTELLDCQGRIERAAVESRDFDELSQTLYHLVHQQVHAVSDEVCLGVSQCLMKSFSGEDPQYLEIYAAWCESVKKRGGLV